MWTCSRCGRSFANLNQSHSCLDLSAAEHLAGRSNLALSIYRVVVEALERCGEFRIHAQKTRIGFISRMTFAGVSLAERWVDLSLISPTVIADPRIRKLFLYGPTSWGHSVRLSNPEDVDGQVETWLCEALRRGDQETLDPEAEVEPLTGRSLELFRTAFRVRFDSSGEELVAKLPGHVAEALALVDQVVARVNGVEYPAPLQRDAGQTWVSIDPGTGLGMGEQVDLYLRVDV
jgi:hypothetical protein